MVRQRAEPLGDFIRVMSDSEVYQDDHVPKGSEAEPLAELACGVQVPCSAALRKERYHHKPVYSLQRHRDVWHVGASAKNALHCKVMRSAIRRCLV